MQTVKVVVKIQIKDGFDPLEAVQDCDYSFSGDGIGETEIVFVLDSDDSTLF